MSAGARSILKTPIGVVLVALYVALFGVAAIRQSSIAEPVARPLGEDIQLVGLGLLCFVAVGALLIRHAMAVRIYFIWTALWLAVGGVNQYMQAVPPMEILGWFGLTGALLVAFGLYFRSALAARPDFPLHLTADGGVNA